MAVNRISGMGYTGFPALLFIEINQYGAKEETYEEMRMRQHKIYSYLRAFLPEFYDNKRADYNENIAPLLNEASERIREIRELYKPTFEGVHTWTDEEMDFQQALDGSFEHLCTIAAKTNVIDKQKMGEDQEPIG